MLKDHRGAKLHPECLEAVQRAAKLCASLGHIVEAELDMVALRPMNARISATSTTRSCIMRWNALGREPNADDVEAATWAVYQRGLKVSGIEYVEAIAAVHAAGCLWRQTQAKDGAGYQPDTWSAEASATRL